MSGLGDQMRANGMTTEQQDTVKRIYRDNQMTPDTYRQNAVQQMMGVDLGKGMQLKETLDKQTRSARLEKAGALMGSGNYAGLADVMSNNDFNPDGRGYKFAGVSQDKAGNKLVNFSSVGPDGKALTHSVDERLLPGMVEATLDGTKGIEYTKEVGRIKHQDRQDNRADQATAISGGHLGIAQQKWAAELKDVNSELEIKTKIRDLRVKLAAAKDDPAEQEKLTYQIGALSGGSGKTDHRYETRISKDMDGNPVTEVTDRATGYVYQGGVPKPGQSNQSAKPANRPPIGSFGSK